MTANERVWPRTTVRYTRTTHFDFKQWKRSIPDHIIEKTLEEGEFFQDGREDRTSAGFMIELDGLGFIVIAGASTRNKPATLITTWAYVIDETQARNASRWSRVFIEKTKEGDAKYTSSDEEVPHPPAYKEYRQKKGKLDEIEEEEGSVKVSQFREEHPDYGESAGD